MERSMKKIYAFCLGTLLALSMSGNLLAAQTTYKWIDKDGHTHYTQKPPAEGSYERLNVQTGHPAASTSGPTYTTPGADSNPSEVIQQTEAKGEEMRQKNCEQAKKALENYTAFRRIRDPKTGAVRILGDDERAQKIEDAKAAIQEFCQ